MTDPAGEKIVFDFISIPTLAGRSFCGDWLLVEKDRIKEFDSSTYVNDDEAGYNLTDYPTDDSNNFVMFEGLHTLGMILTLVDSGLHLQDKSAMGLVYGFDRVRFTSPVYAGQRLRARGTVTEVRPRDNGHLLTMSCVVDIQDQDKPAYVADWSILWLPVGSVDLTPPTNPASRRENR